MLKFYGVPLVVCRDDGATILATDKEVLSFARSQVEGLCLHGYSHSEPLEPEVIAVNSSTALYRSEFSRRHIDGSEIERMGATYFIAAAESGLCIFAMPLIHSTSLSAPEPALTFPLAITTTGAESAGRG
jgi:hypothetical protein